MKKLSTSGRTGAFKRLPADASTNVQRQQGISRIFTRHTRLSFIDMACFVVLTLIFSAFYLSGGKSDESIWSFLGNGAVFLLLIIAARSALRTYRFIWRYADPRAFLLLVLADVIGGTVATLVTIPTRQTMDWLECLLFVTTFSLATIVLRLGYQLLFKHGLYHRDGKRVSANKIGVAIVGAGQTGVMLANELLTKEDSHYRPICFIDKDNDKADQRIFGCPVYPACRQTVDKLRFMPVQEVFIALPSLDSKTAKELHELYSTTGCKVKLYDFPMKDKEESDTNGRRVIREIHIEDLLFRNELKINDRSVKSFYEGKTVLITGGGGSIGSELCRQIAKRHPEKLIIVDIYENNAYEIQQELCRKYGSRLNLAVEIASVRDRTRLNAIFAYYRPEIVFHAAAHKHVPLMEHSNCEAIKNNVFGTYNTADMAEKYGVEKFILISTDKAVNPTNIMGASKRMCEMVIQCRTDSKTSFSAVRFGNVLGSNGSVIPLFKEQIANGGPVTITDKRIIRYFMTIPEASQLVMQAGAMAKSGELFVLDMGKPVKILSLAENMIRLAGYKPYRDIDIVEVGLRPGEKLYEELLMKTEQLVETENTMIFIEKDTPLTRRQVDEKLELLRRTLEETANDMEAPLIRDVMMQVVPTYHLPEEVNVTAEKTEEMKQAGV